MGGAVSQSLERATPRKEVMAFILSPDARSLQIGTMLEQQDRREQKSWSSHRLCSFCVTILEPVHEIAWLLTMDVRKTRFEQFGPYNVRRIGHNFWHFRHVMLLRDNRVKIIKVGILGLIGGIRNAFR